MMTARITVAWECREHDTHGKSIAKNVVIGDRQWFKSNGCPKCPKPDFVALVAEHIERPLIPLEIAPLHKKAHANRLTSR